MSDAMSAKESYYDLEPGEIKCLIFFFIAPISVTVKAPTPIKKSFFSQVPPGKSCVICSIFYATCLLSLLKQTSIKGLETLR